jgi:predicted metal-dependent phosphoesterase TrpH
MRKLFILVMSLCCIGLQAQEDNVQYQLMEGYAKNNIRNRIVVPDIPGYKTLKCDLHMHTIYSDGQVSPTQRVLEAWHEGLDAISITDHQPMPRYFMGTKDCNVSYDKAIGTAKSHHIILIKGVELTSKDPVGHLNFLFINDCNQYMPSSNTFSEAEAAELISKAAAEGAFITANHPGWPDRNSELSTFTLEQIAKKYIRGIEIFNHNEFYPRAIDFVNQYDLAPIGATDAHYPTDFLYDLSNNHRDMTLVFAKDTGVMAIKEALFAGRTLAYTNNILAGKTELLKAFLQASLKIEYYEIENGRFNVRILNDSDVSYLLENGNPSQRIRIPAHQYCDMSRSVQNLNDLFKVTNMYTSSTERLTIPMSFLLKQSETK